MPDNIDSRNPDRHICRDCKREWIAANPNRNKQGDAVCTICLTKNVERRCGCFTCIERDAFGL